MASFFWPPGLSGGGGAPGYPLLAPNGTAGAPSYSFINDPTTGMYLSGVGSLSLSVSATQVVNFTAGATGFIGDVSATGNIQILNDKKLELFDTGSAHHVDLMAAGTTANYTITLPAAAPGSNTFLGYDGVNYIWSTASTSFPLLAPNGAVGAPSYSFTNDPMTGMFISSPGTLVLAISGAQAYVNNGSIAQTTANQNGFGDGSSGSAAFLGVNNVTTGSLALCGNQTTASGAYIRANGSTHATRANQLEFVNAGIQTLLLDASNNATFAGTVISPNFSGVFASKTAVNGSLDTTSLLRVGGGTNPLATTQQNGVAVQYTTTASATSFAIGFFSAVTNAPSVAVNQRVGFYHANQTKGAASTIACDVAYYTEIPTQGTGNVCFADNFTATSNFFIHSTTTNPSLISGAITASSTAHNFGALGLGGVRETGYMLELQGAHPDTGSSFQYGIYSNMVAGSSSTGSAVGYLGRVGTQATSFTVAQVATFQSSSPNKGAGSTITNFTNFQASNTTSKATNNACFSDGNSFTSNWFINQAGTAASQFNGSVIVGTGAISTSATDGFLYLPSCAGTPSGTPTSRTGTNAFVYDTSANKLWVYNGSWRGIVVV